MELFDKRLSRTRFIELMNELKLKAMVMNSSLNRT